MPRRIRGSAGPGVFAGMVVRAPEGMPPAAAGSDTGWLESCSMTGGSGR